MQEVVLTEATYYILLALYEKTHGYGIMQKVERMSDGRVVLSPGTLYGALNTMCDKGWIKLLPVEENSRKKEYQITEKGTVILKKELIRLKELVLNGDLIIGE